MADNDEKDIAESETDSKEQSESSAPAAKSKAKRDDAPARPKDRNARVREEAARKLAESKKGSSQRASANAAGLTTEELVDDALARGSSSAFKWLRANLRTIEVGALVAIVAGLAFAGYDWYADKRVEQASAALIKGVANESGRIVSPEDKADTPQDPEAEVDIRPKFASPDARREAALGAYRVAANQYSPSGPGILARLGEAGMLLDRRDYDGAQRAYREVLGTQLATADADIRLNAKEGLGMAQEGKGELDAALTTFKELESSGVRGYKELGLYHQARLLMAKGQRDDAKTLLKKLRDQVSAPPGAEAQSVNLQFLTEQTENLLRELDPNMPAKSSIGGPGMPGMGMGPNGITPEQLRQLQEQLEKIKGAGKPVQGPHDEQPMPASSK